MSDSASIRGRAEAVDMLLQMEPEAIDDYISSSPCPSTGEYESEWNEAKLREFFKVGKELDLSPSKKYLDSLDGMYWDLVGKQSDLENLEQTAKRLVEEVLSTGKASDHQGSPLSILKHMLGVSV
ncbi:hypothetical protein [Endozoicomonas acroporae]|uniref:hypothetical protein n=1 Tax=Endozoicomonas acroporae TaxID=1701104 RepID=UPI0013D755FA|nr:hypothetical protein [Endozoicomonas acroporae]